MLQNNSEEPCLQKIEELIQEEEFKIEKHLFQNKTILFINVKDHLNKSYRELIDSKLIVNKLKKKPC
jgi:hypothetical protein